MTSPENAVIRLRVFPDYTADPVWENTGMVDLDGLRLSDALVAALRRWAREWETLVGAEVARYEIVDAVAHEAWQRQGHRLTERLQSELGSAYSVQYGM